MNTIDRVIEKYFKGERSRYFHSSDAHRNIEGDTYLTYRNSDRGRIELYLGGDNGECCITVTDNPDKLETLITNIIK